MVPKKSSGVILSLLLLTCIAIYFTSAVFEGTYLYIAKEIGYNIHDNWIFRLILNLFGYSTIFVPGLILYYYAKNNNFFEKSDRSWLKYFIKKLYFDVNAVSKCCSNIESSSPTQYKESVLRTTLLLGICSFGLLMTYLTWGLIQEKIMTKTYTNRSGESKMFKNSQFLVFANRILAFLVSAVYLLTTHQSKHTVPLYKYFYCSFSNIMSSWCQYEALKFISFPTQVLAKACKLIPIIIMGTIISKKRYASYEYVVGILISIGMGLFLMGSADVTKNDETETTLSGLILITGYIMFDSFTSNWQSALFTKYSTTSVQMMCGVNFFSCLLTAVSLMEQQSFEQSFYFMLQFPVFAVDCIFLSLCSTLGQLFIFYTIFVFGPVVFAIIMTVRQALAVILSCILYKHEVRLVGIVGISIVFFGIFLRIYCSERLKTIRKKPSKLPV